MLARLAIVAAIALTAAGCVQVDPSIDTASAPGEAGSVSLDRLPVPDVDFTTVVVADHYDVPNAGHAVRALHGGIEGLEVVGYNPLTDKTPAGSAGTGWSAIGVWENYACVAQLAGTGSVAIVDITDPANPVVTAQTEDGHVNGDCEFTSDGTYLFAGSYLGAAPSNSAFSALPVPGFGDAAGRGMQIWDVSDKANPVLVIDADTGSDFHTHMLHTDDDGTIYLVQAYLGNIWKFDPEAPSFEVVTTITPMDHDMWIAPHPLTGQTLLYSGAGQGMVVYDFDDPTAPVQIGEWQPEEGTRTEAWHRQADSALLIDGKYIVVAAGENCSDGKTEPYAVFDLTDPTKPTLLSEWELPGQPEASGTGANLCTYSPHEFAIHDGYVVSGNYHAGVWLWDIGSAERLLEPATLGYFLPANEPVMEGGTPQNYHFPWTPFVWGAFFDERGYVLTADATSGLYVLKIPGVTTG